MLLVSYCFYYQFTASTLGPLDDHPGASPDHAPKPNKDITKPRPRKPRKPKKRDLEQDAPDGQVNEEYNQFGGENYQVTSENSQVIEANEENMKDQEIKSSSNMEHDPDPNIDSLIE